jgi:hypothetical protein
MCRNQHIDEIQLQEPERIYDTAKMTYISSDLRAITIKPLGRQRNPTSFVR